MEHKDPTHRQKTETLASFLKFTAELELILFHGLETE